MREKELREILEVLQAGKVSRVRGNLLFYCMLAPWTHAKKIDRHPSMEVQINPEGESLYYCFSCKRGGTLSGLIMELNIHAQGAYATLAREVVLAETSLGLLTLEDRIFEDYRGVPKTEAKVFDSTLLDKYKGSVPQYILDRGITLTTCKKWLLGYDMERQRVVFPVFNWLGELSGLVGRVLDDLSTDKYYNYWNFDKSTLLYGEHLLEQEYPYIIVVEGMISTLSVYQAGFRNVVALMGSSLGDMQRKKLAMLNRTIYLMADMDHAGDACRKKFNKELGQTQVLRIVELPKNDPSDCSPEEIKKAFDNAK